MRFSEKYEPLWTKKYRYVIMTGGRASGKSYAGQTFLKDLSYQTGHKILNTRYTMASAQDSIIAEFTEKIESQQQIDAFSLVGNKYTNLKSESEVLFSGIKTSSGIQTAKLKSIVGVTTWALEEAEELEDDGSDEMAGTFDKIDDSIRTKGADLRTILSWNPSNEESFIYKRFFKEAGVDITHNGLVGDTLYIYTTYLDNMENLHPSFVEKANKTKETRPERYNHIYMGIPIKENSLALWKAITMIEPYRKSELPEIKRTVIALDPAVTNTGKQDETGVMVCGEDFSGQLWVIKDLSKQYTTGEWSRAVVGAYHKYGAEAIIAEVNNGGSLIEDVMRNVDENIRVKKVRAKHGKILRAEPVSGMYEDGKVHHFKRFPELELEMTSYTGAAKDVSPNRLDALVYALAYLSGKKDAQISFDFV